MDEKAVAPVSIWAIAASVALNYIVYGLATWVGYSFVLAPELGLPHASPLAGIVMYALSRVLFGQTIITLGVK